MISKTEIDINNYGAFYKLKYNVIPESIVCLMAEDYDFLLKFTYGKYLKANFKMNCILEEIT